MFLQVIKVTFEKKNKPTKLLHCTHSFLFLIRQSNSFFHITLLQFLRVSHIMSIVVFIKKLSVIATVEV